jgi:hypothetical protein
MATRITIPLTAFLSVFAMIGGIAQATPIPSAYLDAARLAEIPAAVLFGIAIQESGMPLHHRIVPWPWTLNIAGSAQRFTTRASACNILKRALVRLPATRIDVGLGQLNVGYQRRRVTEPCALLDPYRNLALAAAILSERHVPGEDWLTTAGRYHRPAGGPAAEEYRHRVYVHLCRVFDSPHPPLTGRRQ